MAMVKVRPEFLGTMTSMRRISSGAAACSSAFMTIGRIVACGHTKEHWLHWMHLDSSELPLAVGNVDELGDGQRVAVHAVDGLHELADLLDDGLATLKGELDLLVLGVGPVGGHLSGGAGVDGLPVGLDDVLALLGVGLLGGGLHVLDGVLGGKNLRQREERGLQHRVGALAHADLLGEVDGVDQVDVDVVLGDVALGHGRQVGGELLVGPLAVHQERAARLDVADHREALDDVGRVVAGDEVGLVDVVRMVTPPVFLESYWK